MARAAAASEENKAKSKSSSLTGEANTAEQASLEVEVMKVCETQSSQGSTSEQRRDDCY